MRIEKEGYLYCVPYAGDDWILTDRPVDLPEYGREYFEKIYKVADASYSTSLSKLLTNLEGKRIRITIEVLEDELEGEISKER